MDSQNSLYKKLEQFQRLSLAWSSRGEVMLPCSSVRNWQHKALRYDECKPQHLSSLQIVPCNSPYPSLKLTCLQKQRFPSLLPELAKSHLLFGKVGLVLVLVHLCSCFWDPSCPRTLPQRCAFLHVALSSPFAGKSPNFRERMCFLPSFRSWASFNQEID